MIILYLYLINIVFSAPSSNYKILDSISKSQSIDISNYLINIKKTEFELHIKSPFNSVIFRSNLYSTFNSLQLNNVEGADSLTLELVEYGVKYNAIELDDNIERIVSIKSLIKNKNFQNIYKDTIERNMVKDIEDANFNELKSNLPEPNKSFSDYIFEPILMVGSGLITLLLLFTIRS